MRSRICVGKDLDGTRCANPTSNPSGRCEAHAYGRFGDRFKPRARRGAHPIYNSRRWRKLREEVISDWIARHGRRCPGWHVPPHPSTSFAVDHVVPLVASGAPFDRANLRVLCRSCNSRKSLKDRFEKR